MDDDDEKSAIKKMVDKVNDAVENIANTGSAAAMEAMELKPDPAQVAGTTKEQVYIPEATDAAAMPAPLFAAPAKKKRALPRATAVKAPAPKKSAKNSAKNKTAKKTAIKESKKAAKKSRAKKQNHRRNLKLPQKRRRSVEDG